MPKPRGKSKGKAPSGKAKLTAAQLLDLERPNGGNNRQLLGLLTTALKNGTITLFDIDVEDVTAGVKKLAGVKNQRVALRARALQAQMVRHNHQLVLAAERIAQDERNNELRAAIRAGSNETPKDDEAAPSLEGLVIIHELAPTPAPRLPRAS